MSRGLLIVESRSFSAKSYRPLEELGSVGNVGGGGGGGAHRGSRVGYVGTNLDW